MAASKIDTDTSTRITILETQVDFIESNILKMEDRVGSNYAVLHQRISDMRDDLYKNIEDKHEKLIDKLDFQTKASSDQHQVISEKIQSIEKWRWMIMGAAIVVGYVLAHIKLDNLF